MSRGFSTFRRVTRTGLLAQLLVKLSLIDKVGGALSAGAAETGGKEHVIQSLLVAMMNAGMIVAGPLQSSYGETGASAVDPVNEAALKEACALGEHVANVARRLKGGCQ